MTNISADLNNCDQNLRIQGRMTTIVMFKIIVIENRKDRRYDSVMVRFKEGEVEEKIKIRKVKHDCCRFICLKPR